MKNIPIKSPPFYQLRSVANKKDVAKKQTPKMIKPKMNENKKAATVKDMRLKQ
ncbi:hypothetical protein BtpYZU02_31 [Brochothrix phage BtpYZU02]|nr:hypothetical protein BtpYZU02_31 [Brochothrix phage BtpYZU02]